MSGGLLALLDDVVALTKLTAASLDDATAQAAKAASNAAGVVIDDTAVTPRYVVGLAAERELPIVGRIALGSLKNKLYYLLPAALVLSAVAPWAVTPLLMLGGLYLCFEGYEKVQDAVASHEPVAPAAATSQAATSAQELENAKVAGAIRTDFVLSAEIMAIALASVAEPSLLVQAFVLAAVAVMVTGGVYGVVALIVKADDFGLYLARRDGALPRALGRGIVYGMPPLLHLLAVVGTLAMLWVGGGILIHGLAAFGLHAPEHAVRTAADAAGALLPSVASTARALCGAVLAGFFGLAAGAVTALIVHIVLPPLRTLLRAA